MISVWFAKFFSGFALWKGEVFGKILYISVIVFSVMFVWNKLTAPTQSSKITNAEVVNIVQPKKSNAGFFGLKLWRMRVGISVE